jgi:hypothetical protein
MLTVRAGNMAQEIASNMVSFFERVVASGSTSTGAHEHQLNNVVNSLLSSSRTCTQLGDQVWTLFEIVQRDLDRDLQPAVQQQRAVRWGWREHAALGGLELARIGGRNTLPLLAGALLVLLSLAAAVLLSLLRRLLGRGRRRQRLSRKKKH